MFLFKWVEVVRFHQKLASLIELTSNVLSAGHTAMSLKLLFRGFLSWTIFQISPMKYFCFSDMFVLFLTPQIGISKNQSVKE